MYLMRTFTVGFAKKKPKSGGFPVSARGSPRINRENPSKNGKFWAERLGFGRGIWVQQ